MVTNISDEFAAYIFSPIRKIHAAVPTALSQGKDPPVVMKEAGCPHSRPESYGEEKNLLS
jgi:hypothetical protein